MCVRVCVRARVCEREREGERESQGTLCYQHDLKIYICVCVCVCVCVSKAIGQIEYYNSKGIMRLCYSDIRKVLSLLVLVVFWGFYFTGEMLHSSCFWS